MLIEEKGLYARKTCAILQQLIQPCDELTQSKQQTNMLLQVALRAALKSE